MFALNLLSPVSKQSENKETTISRTTHKKIRLSSHLHRMDSKKSSRLDLSDKGELKFQLLAQGNIIKEYEQWVNLLIGLINTNTRQENNLNHIDIATPIQKALEQIQEREKENFDLKKKLLYEQKQIKRKTRQLEDLNSELNYINSEFKENNREKLIAEKKQVMESINDFAEELDNLSNKNKIFEIQANESEDISELYKEYLQLREENELLKSVVNIDNEIRARNKKREAGGCLFASARNDVELKNEDLITLKYLQQ